MIDDDDFGGEPDLDEMQTTTQRNRGAKPRGRVAPKSPRQHKAFPKMHTEQPDEGDNPFEGTAPMKKSKTTNNPPPAKGSGGGEKHVGIAIMIQPMANHAEEHRSSIRDSINKAIKTEKRRGPR